jgi:pimeloyl-ACP methyl ester carboxylesterase
MTSTGFEGQNMQGDPIAMQSAASTEVLVEFSGRQLSGRRRIGDREQTTEDTPLIVALHGGTYTSKYFDVPGYSLLDKAAALHIPIMALDRPGYGESTALPPAEATIARNAAVLDEALNEIWRRDGGGRGIVLIGHSIGGAIAISIAARQPSWPLLGVAISGVGLLTPPESGEAWAALPDIPMITLPSELKDSVMFGPDGTFDRSMPQASHVSDAPVPRVELIDIVTTWPRNVRKIASRVHVPVHYRQAEFDRLWIVNNDEVTSFGAAFSNAPDVDARMAISTGHCIDFHRLGGALQLEQLAFALRCAVRG